MQARLNSANLPAQLELFTATAYAVTPSAKPGEWIVRARAPKPLPDLMSTKEAAAALNLAPRTVALLCQMGELAYERKTCAPKSPLQIHKASVTAFKARRKAANN